MKQSLHDTALLLIGHGSTLNADSAAPTYQHASELRRRRIFAEVFEAFWKEEPSIQAALSRVTAPRLVAVPLLISEGYFAAEAIPRELGFPANSLSAFNRIQQRGGQTLHYGAPVGTHQSMTQIILARAREVVEKHPFPRAPRIQETALFVAGHGTERHENSRGAIEQHAGLIRSKNLYADVQAVFMEEEPRVSGCYERTSAKNVVIVPFFMSDGLHSYEDIPIMLGEPERTVRERLAKGQPTWRNPTERKGKLVWYARSVGTEPHLADIILERVQQALQGTTPNGELRFPKE